VKENAVKIMVTHIKDLKDECTANENNEDEIKGMELT
jgi:hypothetical protein